MLDAFVVAVRDEVAAAKSAKGDSITTLTDGRRTQHGADHATYTFLKERSVAASDDVPVELEVGGRGYKGSGAKTSIAKLMSAASSHARTIGYCWRKGT
ncbi:MAG TPA: hypothetical protein VGZ23_07790 [bacterium]|nr:hypothetical protein [bacterium]